MSTIAQAERPVDILRDPNCPFEKGVYYAKDQANSSRFEQLYLQLRSREHRLYSDAQLKELPNAFAYNVHKAEWEWRAKSLKRFLAYVKKKKDYTHILEVGCGNGWFLEKLARLQQFDAYGIDLCLQELQQAAQVFPHPNLFFVYGDILESIFETGVFDLIIFNNSIQYFLDLFKVIDPCLRLLKHGGEIHILDSPIYKSNEIESAQQKDLEYLESIGFSEAFDHIAYHTSDDFLPFPHQYLYRPSNWKNLLRKQDCPYPWLRITKDEFLMED